MHLSKRGKSGIVVLTHLEYKPGSDHHLSFLGSRHYGLSNESTYGVCNFVQVADKLGFPRPVSIQNSYSLLHRTFDNELAEACHYYDIGLLPWSPLGMGVLSGKYLDGKVPAGSRLEFFPDWNGTTGTTRWLNDRCM